MALKIILPMDTTKQPNASRTGRSGKARSYRPPSLPDGNEADERSTNALKTRDRVTRQVQTPSTLPAITKHSSRYNEKRLPLRDKTHVQATHEAENEPSESTPAPSFAVRPSTGFYGQLHSEVRTRELSPMEPEDFGGYVRENISDDEDYVRAKGRESFRREMRSWLVLQGQFHGRKAEQPPSPGAEELGAAAGSAEPRSPDGLAPGVGPHGEMLGDEWRGHAREPALGAIDPDGESYEEELSPDKENIS